MPKGVFKRKFQLARFWTFIDKRGPDECWEWKGSRTNKGYGRFGAGKHTDGAHYAHRIVYTLTYGPIADEMCVCHHCDNPPCCNPDHLFLGTHQDNADDKIAKGRERPTRGSDNPMSILTEATVSRIRNEDISRRGSIMLLSKKYGIAHQTVSKIINRQSWRHIP